MEEYDEDKKAYDGTKEPDEKAGGIGLGIEDLLDAAEGRQRDPLTALDNLRDRIERARAHLGAPVHSRKFPTEVRVPHEPLMRPAGDAAQLLEHQIASSAALMGYIAHFVARPDTDPQTCISFMDRMASMLGANAQVGKVVGRLRGNFSETYQTITVKKVMTGGGVGEGVLET
jgi:hypothetical protein